MHYPDTPTGHARVTGCAADVTREDLPLDDNFRWAQDGYSERRRAIEIWTGLAGLRARLWLLDQKWTYPGGFTEAAKGARARGTAQWLRGAILDLGPTFIKIGQLFSTRSDLFPAEFTEELSQLQVRAACKCLLCASDSGLEHMITFLKMYRKQCSKERSGMSHQMVCIRDPYSKDVRSGVILQMQYSSPRIPLLMMRFPV